MIAKHAPMKEEYKSRYSKLVEYLLNPKTKERVGQILVTNCIQEGPLDAIIEIQAVQARNKRTKKDKTYHLIISFPANERPKQEILTDIEKTICAALGYESHQRISIVHNDTDNMHIHVAINKIHPKTLKIHTPFRDYKILGVTCAELEVKHNLTRTNHTAKLNKSERDKNSFERHTGIESLITWIRKNCINELKNANGWPELHKILSSNNLIIKKQGAGLVIQDIDSDINIKASSVDRSLSKKSLELRLGNFIYHKQSIQVQKQYMASPIKNTDSTDELYKKYQEYFKHNYAELKYKIKLLKEEKNKAVIDTKRSAKLKREAIKITTTRLNKKTQLSLISKSLQNSLKAIAKNYRASVSKVFGAHKKLSWLDWLVFEARRGNADAIKELRARKINYKLEGETLGGKTNSASPDITADTITKTGTIIYHHKDYAITDDGKNVKITRGLSDKAISKLIDITALRCGNKINISGGNKFKEKVLAVAIKENKKIIFLDKALEKRRKELSEEIVQGRSR